MERVRITRGIPTPKPKLLAGVASIAEALDRVQEAQEQVAAWSDLADEATEAIEHRLRHRPELRSLYMAYVGQGGSSGEGFIAWVRAHLAGQRGVRGQYPRLIVTNDRHEQDASREASRRKVGSMPPDGRTRTPTA